MSALAQAPLNHNASSSHGQQPAKGNLSRARSADLGLIYQQETSNTSSQMPPRPSGAQRTKSTSILPAHSQSSSTSSKGSLLNYLSYNNSTAKQQTPPSASDEVSRADMFLESVGRLQKNSNSQLSGYLEESYGSQNNSQMDAEDEATVLTLHKERRKQERDKRREMMRDRMRRERTHHSSDRSTAAGRKQSASRTTNGKLATKPPSRPKIQVDTEKAATPQQTSDNSSKGPPRFTMLKQPSARNLPYQHDESESSVDLDFDQQQTTNAYPTDNPNERSQRSAHQENIFYVSSDNDNSAVEEDDDDDDEAYYAGGGGDDDGTVLQFDPTQTDNVFLVKQFHNSESECEVNNTDGSHSVLSISELKDPMSEAAQHNMSGNLGQKPIFDFLERDDDGEEEEAEQLPSNSNSYKTGSGHTASSTASTNLSSSNINNNTSLELNSSGERNRPRAKSKKKRAGNKLVQDAQKYSQFFKSNYLVNGVRLPNSRKGSKEIDTQEGRSEMSARRKVKAGGKKKTRRPEAPSSQASIGTNALDASEKGPLSNPLRDSRKMSAQNHNIHNNVDETSSDEEAATSIAQQRRLNSLNEFFPSNNATQQSQVPADPPSGTSSVSGGSLIAPSGGESVSTAPSTPSKRRGLRFGKASKQSRVAAAEKTYETDLESRPTGSSNLAEIAVNPNGNLSDVAPPTPSKKIGGGLGIGRYFARSGSSARGGAPESDRDDDDNRSIMSSLSRGLFNRNRPVGPEGHAILLGDDSSSYGESSSANTR